MRVKILRYAAGRDDKIVSAFEEITFENEHMGWYVDSLHGSENRKWDTLAIVERVGDVCFVACFMSRYEVLNPEFIKAITDEARHLQSRIMQRIDNGQWIPLPYLAAFEALGWDTRPLVAHRNRIIRLRKERTPARRTTVAGGTRKGFAGAGIPLERNAERDTATVPGRRADRCGVIYLPVQERERKSNCVKIKKD